METVMQVLFGVVESSWMVLLDSAFYVLFGFFISGLLKAFLPDDLILGMPGCLSEMAAAYEDAPQGHMVATMTVAPEDTSKYGILSTTNAAGQIMSADGMVEKPDPAEAPSREAVVGRYILDGSIFDDLETQTPGAGGEIQLTDAIARGIGRVGLAGFRFTGRRSIAARKPACSMRPSTSPGRTRNSSRFWNATVSRRPGSPPPPDPARDALARIR